MLYKWLYLCPTTLYLSKFEFSSYFFFPSYNFIQIYLTIYILKKNTHIVKVKKIHHLFLKALIKSLTYFILRKVQYTNRLSWNFHRWTFLYYTWLSFFNYSHFHCWVIQTDYSLETHAWLFKHESHATRENAGDYTTQPTVHEEEDEILFMLTMAHQILFSLGESCPY